MVMMMMGGTMLQEGCYLYGAKMNEKKGRGRSMNCR